MEVVRAEPADVDRLAELNKQLIEDERHPNPMDVAQLGQRMKDWLAGGYTCYLAKRGGRIIAYCLYRDDGAHYYMRQLYVTRENRRRGIGTQLLDWLYENVWTDKRVRLDVLAHNTEAVAFYERYGYRIGVHRMEK